MTNLGSKEKFLKGGELAIKRLLERKRKDNSYIIVSQNGNVVRLYANDIKP